MEKKWNEEEKQTHFDSLTLILLMLIRDSESFSMAKGKKRVMVSLTAPYRQMATKTVPADSSFPTSTYTQTVMKMMILLATEKDAMFSPRK